MLSRRAFLGPLIAAPLAFAPLMARAGSRETYNTGGIAINGYDPVAYFKQDAPVQGSAKHALMWMGATWYFANAANMAAFEADPRAYAPQYGGYCAYAAAQGQMAPTVPEAFTIHGGKLYLNYSTDVRGLWQQDIAGNVAKADAHWPQIDR